MSTSPCDSSSDILKESASMKTKVQMEVESEKEIPVSNKEDSALEPEVAGFGDIVATHYNQLEEKGLNERNKSRIVYLRNFNNWVKSVLIGEYLSKAKDGRPLGTPVRVLDMGCGKGGDLLKWRKGEISYLICADLAATSVEQCKSRFHDMKTRNTYDRSSIYKAEFIAADCTKVRLREKYQDPSIQLDLTSCQFAFHYSFESLSQAEVMLCNAAECLRPGGYFVGTIPDAYEIVKRLNASKSNTFGNDVYRITFDEVASPFPLFGSKYNFHLEEVVDCPEFLVHFPTLVKLAAKYNLELVMKQRFDEFFEKNKSIGEARNLLSKMQALETYPPYHKEDLADKDTSEYEGAEKYVKENSNCKQVGTLSKSEWEAATLYLVFAFQKVKGIKQKVPEEDEESKEQT